MQTITHIMRGIPLFLLKEYLEELGGTQIEENTIRGDGWMVKIERMDPFKIGSLEVGQNQLTMELEDRVADDFIQRFRLKTLRAGG